MKQLTILVIDAATLSDKEAWEKDLCGGEQCE